MDTLFADAVALIEALDLKPVHVCGLSMGGFVAMRLGARRPDLVRSLLLLDTSADAEPPKSARKLRLWNWFARCFGIGFLVDATMPIMLGESTLSDPARAAERNAWRRRLRANRPSLWRAVNGVIERPSVHHELSSITAPTLIMVGEEDTVTVSAKAERIAAAIAGAKLVRIPHAGHVATVEQPQAITRAIESFLDGLDGPATAPDSTTHKGRRKELAKVTNFPGSSASTEDQHSSTGGTEIKP
jgi:pimeloyl-ACP methyl ester carboxylesterase